MGDAKILELLQQISTRLARVEAKVGAGGGADEGDGPAPQVVAVDAWMSEKVEPFLAACAALSYTEMADIARAAYGAMRNFIDMASQCYKPEQAELMAFAKGMIDQHKAAGNFKRDKKRTDQEHHAAAFCEALQGSIGWTLSPMPPPAKQIEEAAVNGSMFYINKVRRAHKGEDAHDTWVKSLLQMLNALKDYVKEHHKAGLTWSFKAQGAKPCSEYSPGGGSAAAAAPAAAAAESKSAAPAAPAASANPTPAAPAAKKAGAPSRAALFAGIRGIDQSGGRTAGLRRVVKDSAGKKFVEDDPAKRMTDAKRQRLAKMRGKAGGAGKKSEAKTQVKPPVKALKGFKWQIENQTGMCELAADDCKKKQTVYIYNCNGATIQVQGKVNAVIVDKCVKTNVLFSDVLGGVEVVNCKRVKVQANASCPTVAIDKTDGIVVYAGQACYEGLSVVASKSSEMNLSWPGATPDDAWNEAPIPEQYQHHIVDGKITCDVSDLYSH